MRVFESNPQTRSVAIAKERLKALIVSDRVQCKPDTYELLCSELYHTIAKYIEVTEEHFDVEVTRSKIFITLTGEEA